MKSVSSSARALGATWLGKHSIPIKTSTMSTFLPFYSVRKIVGSGLLSICTGAFRGTLVDTHFLEFWWNNWRCLKDFWHEHTGSATSNWSEWIKLNNGGLAWPTLLHQARLFSSVGWLYSVVVISAKVSDTEHREFFICNLCSTSSTQLLVTCPSPES